MIKSKEQLNAWLWGIHILQGKEGSRECKLQIEEGDSELYITQNEIWFTDWGIFTRNDRKGGFSLCLIHGGKVLLRIMKEVLDYDLEINQDFLKVFTHSHSCMPWPCPSFCFNKPSHFSLFKIREASRFSFEPHL